MDEHTRGGGRLPTSGSPSPEQASVVERSSRCAGASVVAGTLSSPCTHDCSTEMEGEGRVLVIGGTGHIGRWIVQASIKQRHPTYLLVTPRSISSKSDLLQSFVSQGCKCLQGSLEDYKSLVEAVKQVDVVVSAVASPQLLDQTNIIEAIKEAGAHIKRFVPSEFGVDVDTVEAHNLIQEMFKKKAQIRRVIEAANIPHTYICSFLFADYFLRSLGQPGRLEAPPRSKVLIYGDGNTKVPFLCEEEIGSFTVKLAHDPRALNKVAHLRLPKMVLTHNEMVRMWESKIGHTLEKEFMSEEEMLKVIEAPPYTFENGALAIKLAIFVHGHMSKFQLNSHDIEASELFPDASYTSAEEYLQKFV